MSCVDAYSVAFEDATDAPFVTYHGINETDKSLTAVSYTRKEFLQFSLKALNVMVNKGLKKGDHVLHVFSGQPLRVSSSVRHDVTTKSHS